MFADSQSPSRASVPWSSALIWAAVLVVSAPACSSPPPRDFEVSLTEPRSQPWSDVTYLKAMASPHKQAELHIRTDEEAVATRFMSVRIGSATTLIPERILQFITRPILGQFGLTFANEGGKDAAVSVTLIGHVQRPADDNREVPTECDADPPQVRIEIANQVVTDAWIYDYCLDEGYRIDPSTGRKSVIR